MTETLKQIIEMVKQLDSKELRSLSSALTRQVYRNESEAENAVVDMLRS